MVRLDTGGSEPLIHLSHTDEAGPVRLEREEFSRALAKEVRHRKFPANPERVARELFGVPPRTGWYGYTQPQGIVPLDAQPPASQWAEADVRVTQEYLRYCEALGKPGDCRKVLMNGPVLTGDGRVGIRLVEVAQVEAVAVSAEAVTIALAPNAVAATTQSVRGAASGSVDAEGPVHHIASDKFSTSTNNGGPWTPRYQELFDKAGMSLDDAANKVRVPGHQGPHPQEYHEEVFRRLREATLECRSIHQCQEALTSELQRLGRLISTPGTRLNKLVTRSP